MTIRVDEAHHLWFVEEQEGPRAAYDSRHPFSLLDIRPLQVADGLRPPDAFVALAALGVVVALAGLLRRPASELPADEGSCVDAYLGPDGTVRIADRDWPLPADVTTAEGPVVAVLETRGASFRGHAGEALLRVVPGTVAEHALAAYLGNDAFALAFVVIATTPLAAAIAYLS